MNIHPYSLVSTNTETGQDGRFFVFQSDIHLLGFILKQRFPSVSVPSEKYPRGSVEYIAVNSVFSRALIGALAVTIQPIPGSHECTLIGNSR